MKTTNNVKTAKTAKTYEDLVKMIETKKIIGNFGKLIGRVKGGNSYTVPNYVEVTDENLTDENLTDVEKRYLEENGIEKITPEVLKELNFSVFAEIEGTKVELSVNFGLEYVSSYSSRKRLTYTITGKRHFRKESKKAAYQKAYNEFVKYCESTLKDLKAAKEKYEKTLSIFDDIRYSIASAEKMGISYEEFLNGVELFTGYETCETDEEKLQFLKENNFSGIENFGIYNNRPDGFGHQLVTHTDINFIKKEVRTLTGCSCD